MDYKMNKQGFITDKNGNPPNCNQCGKQLGQNYKPAEYYAGTYTGLCYDCEKGKPYTVKEYFDGAITISYPPHCPSFRRDREEFITYNDCKDCGGTGRHYISREPARGGSYYGFCEPCLNKFSRNPRRVADRAFYDCIRDMIYEDDEYYIDKFLNEDIYIQ